MNNSILPTYNRSNLSFERGQGSWLETKSGERYLDFSSGIAVNSLGHCHPKLVQAITDQASKLWHTSNLHRIDLQEKLADFLVSNSFADKIFFTNSGAESVECAIKIARKFFYEKGNKKKNKIITFEGSFHGRTLGTIAASGEKKLTRGFEPNLQGFDRVPIKNLDKIYELISERTAAILIEPIQGEGGIRCFEREFIKELRKICNENDSLLIFDEVQCGIGRTGTLFAYENFNVVPDIVAIAKGLGGGFPIGACLATEEASIGMVYGTHGSTYGGNPLACAVAYAVLKEITNDGFLDNVIRNAIILKQKLSQVIDEYPDIFEDVRGEGLMLGLKCRVDSSEVVRAGYDERILCVGAADNVVRILPPLNISESDIQLGINKLEKIAKKLLRKRDNGAT